MNTPLTLRLSAALAACCTTVLLLVAVVAIGDEQRAAVHAERAPAASTPAA